MSDPTLLDPPDAVAAETPPQASSQRLLDQSLEETFPASDPISPDSAMKAAASRAEGDGAAERDAEPERPTAAAIAPGRPVAFPRSAPRLAARLSPGITDMIRMDHSHVMLLAHRYRATLSPGRKQAIVHAACAALEIHAQLEEEIFYPALAGEVGGADVQASRAEHEEMRSMIEGLRTMDSAHAHYDERFMDLMRLVQHHVADEETVLLPEAERLLGPRLRELGARMNQRRLVLVGPRLPRLIADSARAMPVHAAVAAGAVVLFGLLLVRAVRPRTTREVFDE